MPDNGLWLLRSRYLSNRCVLAVGLLAALSLVDIKPLLAHGNVVFFDDFSGTSLNLNNWNVEQRPGNSNGHSEQYFLPSAISVDSRGLHLAIRQLSSNDERNSVGGMHYVGARIETRRSFLYGYFEFRARLPQGGGLWPALWMRTALNVPFNGEIDVVEGFGSNPNIIRSSVRPWKNGKLLHFDCVLLSVSGSPPPGHDYGRCRNVDNILRLPDSLAEQYHTYAVDWRPDAVRFLFDNRVFAVMTGDIPKEPMILVLDTAVSSKYDGPVTAHLPQWLDVKYVRVLNSVGSKN